MRTLEQTAVIARKLFEMGDEDTLTIIVSNCNDDVALDYTREATDEGYVRGISPSGDTMFTQILNAHDPNEPMGVLAAAKSVIDILAEDGQNPLLEIREYIDSTIN